MISRRDKSFQQLITHVWVSAATYYPHSDRQIFVGIKPFGAEDPMLWTQKDKASGRQAMRPAIVLRPTTKTDISVGQARPS